MGHQFEVTIRFSSNEDYREDFNNPMDAVKSFLYHGTRHQDHGTEIISSILVTEVECIRSDDGKHFTFENEEGADYWTEWWQYKEDEWIREQNCFYCCKTVEETSPHEP